MRGRIVGMIERRPGKQAGPVELAQLIVGLAQIELGLALIIAQRGRFEQAMEVLREILDLNPDDAEPDARSAVGPGR